MTIVTLKINDDNKAAKGLLEFLMSLPFVKVEKEESPYSAEFVAKIRKSEKSKKRFRVENVNDLWESL